MAYAASRLPVRGPSPLAPAANSMDVSTNLARPALCALAPATGGPPESAPARTTSGHIRWNGMGRGGALLDERHTPSRSASHSRLIFLSGTELTHLRDDRGKAGCLFLQSGRVQLARSLGSAPLLSSSLLSRPDEVGIRCWSNSLPGLQNRRALRRVSRKIPTDQRRTPPRARHAGALAHGALLPLHNVRGGYLSR